MNDWRVGVSDGGLTIVVRDESEMQTGYEIVAKPYAIEGMSATEVARLIAAAPKLLAACKRMMQLVKAFDRELGQSPGLIWDAMGAIHMAEQGGAK